MGRKTISLGEAGALMNRMQKNLRDTLVAFLMPLIVPALFLLGWQVLADRLANPIILPSFTASLANLLDPFNDLVGFGSLASNILISLARVLAGFFLACLIGIPLGLGMGYSHFVNTLFAGTLSFMRSIPPLAWVPLVLAWFGMVSLGSIFGVGVGPYYSFFTNIKMSMLAIIFIGGVYPVLLSCIHGVRQVPKTLLDASLVLGAKKKDIVFQIIFPAALPNIINGMRIGLGVAWTCLVSAEMLPGTPAGLGYLITHAFSVGRTDVVITGMICIGITGICLDWIFKELENKKFAWRQTAK